MSGAVTAAALVMAFLLPVSGVLSDRFGARAVYASGIATYAIAVFPIFALFNTKSITAYAIGMLLVFGVVHAWFHGAPFPMNSAQASQNCGAVAVTDVPLAGDMYGARSAEVTECWFQRSRLESAAIAASARPT